MRRYMEYRITKYSLMYLAHHIGFTGILGVVAAIVIGYGCYWFFYQRSKKRKKG